MDARNDNNLKKYLKKRLIDIKNDFAVIERIQDGCDKDGLWYYYECKNGWYGRSWDLDPAIKSAINVLFNYIIENGYSYKGTMYYYNKKSVENLKEIMNKENYNN